MRMGLRYRINRSLDKIKTELELAIAQKTVPEVYEVLCRHEKSQYRKTSTEYTAKTGK